MSNLNVVFALLFLVFYKSFKGEEEHAILFLYGHGIETDLHERRDRLIQEWRPFRLNVLCSYRRIYVALESNPLREKYPARNRTAIDARPRS